MKALPRSAFGIINFTYHIMYGIATIAKKNITQAIKQAASQLGNRPATCRKYYVHPAIIDAYLDGSLLPTMEQQKELETEGEAYALRKQERGVLAVLSQQLVQPKQ